MLIFESIESVYTVASVLQTSITSFYMELISQCQWFPTNMVIPQASIFQPKWNEMDCLRSDQSLNFSLLWASVAQSLEQMPFIPEFVGSIITSTFVSSQASIMSFYMEMNFPTNMVIPPDYV
jgi:hypothetical protein